MKYVITVKGKKVDIVYKTPDVDFARSFLKHVVSTSVLEDISIKIKGPPEEKTDMIPTAMFCVSTCGILNGTSDIQGHRLRGFTSSDLDDIDTSRHNI